MTSPGFFWKKSVASLFALVLVLGAVAPAQAGLIGTERVLGQARADEARQEVVAMIERQAVSDRLEAMGVSPRLAKERVARMSDAEIRRLHGRLESAPAGGEILGLAVLVFVVFVITDAVGATDIFPFIHEVD